MLRFATRPDPSLLSPRFVICAVIMATAAYGLRPAMSRIADRYVKERIAPRRSLREFDISALSSFREGDGPKDTQPAKEDIGTEELFLLSLEEIAWRPQDFKLWLFVTYYSDPRDTVPHTVDVCARQTGWIVQNIATASISVPALGVDRPPIQISTVDLEKETWLGVVGYVFCVNGKYCCTRDQVRWLIGQPGDKYTYFSKIEATVYYKESIERKQAVEVCKKILVDALPVLVSEYFPTASDLKGQ